MLSSFLQSKHLHIAALLALFPATVISGATSAQSADEGPAPKLVSRVEGEALAHVALQHWPQIRDKPDCSHLVHDIYSEAGLDYEYATTNDIFDGIEVFQLVHDAQAGDLVVWRGHVGIVIDPEDHSFYSSVISGFSVSSFSSSYWESRGPRRFYRYKINAAQSARLFERASDLPLRSTIIKPASYEATFIDNRKSFERDALEAEPDVRRPQARRDGRSEDIHENRIVNAVVTIARKPTQEEIRSAFVKLSDSNAARLQGSEVFDGPIEIIDGFEAGRIEAQGSSGWVELKIKTIAAFADGRLNASNRTMKVRFTLLRQADGWALQAPANRSYVLRPAAVRMITARLAALARKPDGAKDLKPLTRALAILVGDDHS